MTVLVILASLLALAVAQGNRWNDFINDFNNNDKYDYTIDFVHNYRFEDHSTQIGYHLIVAISDYELDRSCHVIEVGDEWESYLNSAVELHHLTDEIYNLITNHQIQATELTLDQLKYTYGDNDALLECFQHTVYLVFYIPSFTTPTPTPTPRR